jgi:3-oxoacyl-[acyl-carrier protein] reductase
VELNIAQRRAFVVGASRGLGAAIARGLLAEGATVYAAARDPAAMDTWRAELAPAAAARLHTMRLDLSQPDGVGSAATEALRGGAIDILVNNSGGPPPGSTADASPAQWHSQFQQMAVALFTLTGLLLPQMLERRWGRIITIASSGVQQPIANLALSNTIRSSIVGWSKTLASEVAGRGVTVNVLIPGRIHTDRVDELDRAAAARQGKSVAEVAAASAASIPAGRYGTPEEFADVATFLVSDRAAYVTGTTIRIDGGMIRSI